MVDVPNRKTADGAVYRSVGIYGEPCNAAKIEIKDGHIARIRPLEFYEKYNEEEISSWSFEARGHTFKPNKKFPLPGMTYGWKNRIYSKNRIPYPLKRVDWEPGGDPAKLNTQNRGKSKYVRISWDEALQIMHDEIVRVNQTYGAEGIMYMGDGHGQEKNIGAAHGGPPRLLDILGGYTRHERNPDSWEGWYWGAKHIWGMDPTGKQIMGANLVKDIAQNSDAVLFWGCDVMTTTVTAGGHGAARMTEFWHECGVKQIYICPDNNYACCVYADKWIPVLPNTDAAMQLAIAYVWITEGTYESEYVETHTVGFDHFKFYVLGKEDGEPKTPKWAESKCGIPARDIIAFARYWATHNVSIAHMNGGGYIRGAYSHEPARLEVTLLAMQGLGMPGRNQISMSEWGIFGTDSTKAVYQTKYKLHMGAVNTGQKYGVFKENMIPKTLAPKALRIKEGEKLDWYGHISVGFPRPDQFEHVEYPVDGCSRVHMIWGDAPCWTTCWNGGFDMQDAFRDPHIECIVLQHCQFENDCQYADILLPTTTIFEQDDIQCSESTPDHEAALTARAAIKPVGESRDDFDVMMSLAATFGPEVREALLRDVIQGLPEDFDISSLGDDYRSFMRKWGWDKAWEESGVEQAISWEEFEEKGYFLIPADTEWHENTTPGMYDFYVDPDNNPLKTPTGKIEIYATGLAKNFPDDQVRTPIPRWIEEDELHHERLTNDRGLDYPFLLVSNHPHFRLHAQNDDLIWMREIPMCKVNGPDGYKYEPVWINPVDARPLGIKTGDIVSVFNERGQVLGGAIVTERIAPHCLSQDHGARVDAIISGPGGIDRGGANNLICPSNTTSKNAAGEVTNGFLVNIKKVDVFELARQYPEAFSRDYDPADGMHVSGYIIEEA